MKIHVETTLLKSLLALATLIEARDAYTGGHTWRVSQYSKLLAVDLGMNNQESFAVQIGALVHDLGKVGIPDNILNKKGALDDKEYAQIKGHPEIGLKAIKDHPLKEIISTAIGDHHKRPDGMGYPGTKKNETLSTIARIVSLSDAFDAMTSSRSYRNGMSKEKAFSIIMENLNTQFDKDLSYRLFDLDKKNKLDGILAHAYNEVPMLCCPGCGPVIAPSEDHNHDGDGITCPACTGEFTLHKHKDTFELEYDGTEASFYVPAPDNYSIQSVMNDFQEEIEL